MLDADVAGIARETPNGVSFVESSGFGRMSGVVCCEDASCPTGASRHLDGRWHTFSWGD